MLGELFGLRRYARALTRNDIYVEDLVHDALIRAYEKRASFRARHELRVWLLSILHSVFIDGARARTAETQRRARVGELAGFAIALLGRIPGVGDQFTWGGWRFQIADMDGPRISKVLVSTGSD